MLPPVARHARTWMFLLALVFLSRAADTVYSGALERVGPESISVRLQDGRMIDARIAKASTLTSGGIVARYSMGDQVQINCMPIQPVWDEVTSSYQSMVLTGMQLVRHASPEELSKLLDSYRDGVNLLTRPNTPGKEPDAREVKEDPKLEHAREVNIEYASNMPNFVADETAKRYIGSSRLSTWKLFDTIVTEITFKGPRAIRQQIRRDGRIWDRPFEQLPGFKWYGGFGTEIRPLFDPQCPTSMQFVKRAEVRGKNLLEYKFNSPPDGCFATFYDKSGQFNPVRNGHAYIEDPEGNVIQYDEDATGFPAAFEFAERKEEVSWDYVKIGEATHLLPVSASFVVRASNGQRWKVEIEYRNHRHFEATSNLKF